jgi:haloacid dehalogenase superfamily, subfamily IA, variant 1 with third motif having Dx(3-4)D or Dx(3-4)E
MKKFFVFDLDGTLIDTSKGITEAVNNTLKKFNYGFKYTEAEVIKFLGHGARYLYSKATKKNVINENEFAEFQIEYVKTQNISEVFPNVKDVLNKLAILGIPLIIFSNKPNGALQFLIKEKLGEIKWSAIQGNVINFPVKPDVTLLNKIMHELNLNPQDGFYVGDSVVDCETARNAKLKSVILTYGYGDYSLIDQWNPDYKFKEFSDLLTLL